MTTTLTLKIPGKPISKKNPLFFRKKTKSGKGFVTSVNMQKTEEGRFLYEVEKQLDSHMPFKGPVRVNLRFYLQRPKYHYGTGKNAGKLKLTAPFYPVVTPDWDRLSLFVCDCLKGIGFVDDRQIVDALVIKRYSHEPGTVIVVQELIE